MRPILALCALFLLGAAAEERLPPPLNTFLIENYGTDANAHFVIAWADLNGDGEREAIVRIVSHGWCGTAGCALLILQPDNGGYRVVTRVTGVPAPVRLLTTSTEGWLDLSVHRRFDATRSDDIVLRFDGRSYPESLWGKGISVAHLSGKTLIEPDDAGIPLNRQ